MFSGKSSFRRILVSRLLLVSLPILLIGVYVTYRKARSAFLDTTRQNLTESAIRKANNLEQSIHYLRGSLLAASSSYIFQESSQPLLVYQQFIDQLNKELFQEIYCLEINQVSNNQTITTNCQKNITLSHQVSWPKFKKQDKNLSLNKINIKIIQLNFSKFYLHLSTPIYDKKGQLKYILSFVANFSEPKIIQIGSLSGYSVIINEKGTIIAHPEIDKIGKNIRMEKYEERLSILLYKAIKGEQGFIHLFSSESNQTELVAGYSSILSPITGEEGQKWIVLAVSPLEQVLDPLKEIQVTLFYMVFTLIFASVLAMLYIAYELARPIEQIRDYALNKENLDSREELPKNISIKEFAQLAQAIQQMLERLQNWGEEITLSWREAQKANQIKNEFLTTISHELRTPLNGIINCIRIVKDGYCEDKKEEREFLEQADIGAIHLFKIINDLLDIGKIEAGKMTVSLEPVDLQKIITEVISMQKTAIQEKGLTLIEPQWQHKVIVQADSSKIKQVLLNLLNNAIKFSDQGSIKIDVKIEDQKDKLLITVKDTGIGIDSKDQNKLFRPFVMVDSSRTRKVSGTGLGLAICYNLMELMQGTITLDSAGVGKGTTLYLTLPIIELIPLGN